MTITHDGRPARILAADVTGHDTTVTIRYLDDEDDDKHTARLVELSADRGTGQIRDIIADLPGENITGRAPWLNDRRNR